MIFTYRINIHQNNSISILIRRLDPVEYHRWSDRTNATMRHNTSRQRNPSQNHIVSRYNAAQNA